MKKRAAETLSEWIALGTVAARLSSITTLWRNVMVRCFTAWNQAMTLALLAVSTTTACDGDGGGQCMTNDECGPGQFCLDGVCATQTSGDADADTDADSDADAPVDGAPCAVSCDESCCETDERCVEGGCFPDNGTCGDGEPCQNDTSCIEGVCLPFGVGPLGEFDEACSREPEPLDAFEAEIQCEWPGEHVVEDGSHSVRVPPLVADLDDDGVPEIIFVSHGGAGTYVRAIRGDDCNPVWTSDHSQDCNQELAIADLDGDGRPEICGRGDVYATQCAPYCLSADGTLFWDGHDESGNAAGVVCSQHNVGISVANIDGLGSPEVVVGLDVFDGLTGLRLSSHAVPTEGFWAWASINPALADVDGDGHVEALSGRLVYDLVSGEEVSWGTTPGFTAVAELSPEHDGPEVVVVSPGSSSIRVHSLDGGVLFEHSVPGGSGGAPTVADFDGDGQPEFSTAGREYLTVFDLDCVGTSEDPPEPDRCFNTETMDGVLWSMATHEYTSGVTGSSVFDFEGDGAVEVVYGDECWTRVYDGATGAIKFSAPHNSGTGIEYPVVADVDGDFYAEIVVPHEYYEVNCPAEDPLMPGVTRETGRRYQGITVYRDRNDRWAPSRPLWTQHTEHWSQRFDNATVPAVEAPSWLTHNSYRQALPAEGGTAIDSPDLTVGSFDAPECDMERGSQPLSGQVCNRGTLPVAAGVEASFRVGTSTGEVACEAWTTLPLEPGECEVVGCDWVDVPLDELQGIVVTVDSIDEGEELGIDECHEDNNTTAGEARCPPALE